MRIIEFQVSALRPLHMLNSLIYMFICTCRRNDSLPVVNSDILSSKVLNVNEKTFSDLTDPVKLVFNLQV